MVDKIFKPNLGVLSNSGMLLNPKAFSIEGLGVFDFFTGKKLLPASSISELDPNVVNKLLNTTKKRKQIETRSDLKTYAPILALAPEYNIKKPQEVSKDNIGMLIAPYIILTWGGKKVDPQWFKDIEWSWGKDENPGGLSFRLDPMSPFADYPLKKGGEGAEIELEFGYSDKRIIKGTFIHTGTSINSGTDMSISIEASHKSFIADQTPQRNKHFVGKNPVKIIDNFKQVLDPNKIKLDDQTDYRYTFMTATQAETDYKFILRNAQNYGLTVLPTFDKKTDVVIKPPFDKWVNGVKTTKEKEKIDQKESYVYYLGPGLVTSIQRSIKAQKMSSPVENNTSESNPTVKASKTHFLDVFTGIARGTDAIPKKEKPVEPVGAAAKPNAPTLPSQSQDTTVKDTEQDKKIEENQVSNTEAGQIEMTTDFLMLPRVCGIKSGDFVVIMWMDDNKNSIYQDYLVNSVSYKQHGAGFAISIQASRWLKEKPMIRNWSEVLKDMEKRGLLQSLKTDHSSKLLNGDAYPLYQNYIKYYWGL